MRTYDDWKALLSAGPLPAAVVDLEALEHNLAEVLDHVAEGRTLRLASKSVRVPAVLRHLLERGGDRVQGLMTYSAHETARLAEDGFEDLLLAYPVARRDEAVALATAARRTTVRAVIDAPEQARLISEAASGAGAHVGLCIEVDVAYRPAGGLAHLGVRRSPIRDGPAAVALAQAVRDLPGVSLDAVMAYEAQVAGLPDQVRGQALLAPVRRLIKARSIPVARRLRDEVVSALTAAGATISLVNGGGTGSVVSTSLDPRVTEITAGSGFLCSHLFDGYDALDLQPASFFALAVVRRPDPQHVTCAGGGYGASGPPGADRQPLVHAPAGLAPLGMEGWGEVQTPFRVGDGAPSLRLGDPVVCRFAKAGEPLDRFREVRLVRGDVVVETVPTYRGRGWTFF